MSDKPKTFAEQFYNREEGFVSRRRREFKLVVWLIQNIVLWFKSRKVRAEFEQCRKSGKPFYVDRFTPPWQKNETP